MNQSLSKRKLDIARNFSNASNYNQHACVQAQVCDLLLTEIADYHPKNVLEIGAGEGQLTKKMMTQITPNQWHINELCEVHRNSLQSILPDANILIGDAESLSLPNQQNLVISANAVQWFDNPLTLISNASNLLNQGGQLLFNTFTPNNFFQIKKLTGQGLNYPSIEQWKSALQTNGFSIASLSTHQFQISFDSPKAVLQHVKQTGVSVNHKKEDTTHAFRWTKTSLKQFINDYIKHFSTDNGKVILTYDVLIISAFT